MSKRHAHRHRSHSVGVESNDSRFAKAVVFLLAAGPMAATLLYGAVDIWALIPLSVLTVAIAAFWTLEGIKTGTLTLSRSDLQFPLLALLLLAGVQLLPVGSSETSGLLTAPVSNSLTMDRFSTVNFAVRLLYLFVFFAAALTFLNGKRRSQRVVVAAVIFGAIMAFAGILQRLASPDAIYGMRPTPQAIPFGPFVNQHHFAAFMEMTIGLTLAAVIGHSVKRDRKALLGVALALMAIAIIMTGSRGGMIGTAFVVLLVFVFERLAAAGRSHGEVRTGWTVRSTALVASVALVAAVAALYVSGADPLLRGLGIENREADLTGGRFHFWSIAWRIFLDNPITGAGFDAFGVAFTRYDTWHGLYRVEQAHNDYLQMLADGGVLAFACVAVFVFLLVRRGIAVIRTSSSPTRKTIAVGALAGCCGILLHSFFDFPLRTVSNSYFFLLLAALATIDLEDERTAEN